MASFETHSVVVRLTGGMEAMFGGCKEMAVPLMAMKTASSNSATLCDLLLWLRDNKLETPAEHFMDGNQVRAGILVLVNDIDYELEGGKSLELHDGDEIVFISTLHGG